MEAGNTRFQIREAQAQAGSRGVAVRLDQTLRFSRPAMRAIRNGVPLVISLQVQLRGDNGVVIDSLENNYRISYLPLSERFELSDLNAQGSKTYPRLRHVTQELSTLRLRLEAPALEPGDYELRTRVRLDQRSLPAPMQLPALVRRSWHHDSDWSRWPFRINA